jgi:capsular polysaccharide biosynthesis protein
MKVVKQQVKSTALISCLGETLFPLLSALERIETLSTFIILLTLLTVSNQAESQILNIAVENESREAAGKVANEIANGIETLSTFIILLTSLLKTFAISLATLPAASRLSFRNCRHAYS